MDPTKPILGSFRCNLDLYSDYSSDNAQRQYKSVRSPPPVTQKYSRPTPQKEISYAELKVFQFGCSKNISSSIRPTSKRLRK